MNLQRLFQAVADEPDQPTLLVVAIELERQGYSITVADKHCGSAALLEAEENGDLNLIPKANGVRMDLEKNGEQQSFRIQFLDVDAICITDIETLPVIYDPKYTTGFYKAGEIN